VIQRVRISIRGAVQGVGFRPFVYRLASELKMPGWVSNSPQGVFIEVEGERPELEEFVLRLSREKPPRCFIQSLEFSYLDAVHFNRFEIRESVASGGRSAVVLPDIAVCDECMSEVSDPENRRYRYPFTNCTNCGPRFSIIEALPYDRANTTMRAFRMCAECLREYQDPTNRRFHAQPNACPACGPHLELLDRAGAKLALRDQALTRAAGAIREGRIVAVKGLGGFHLMTDAGAEDAVRRLRERKHREEKPFALMFPSLNAIKAECRVAPLEERLLLSPESPIVLLRRAQTGAASSTAIAPSVAPRNPYLGVMLPYTPLHHLLMQEAGKPVVATSGNLSDEPICTDEAEALQRLGGIADLFLIHDRPIARHVDDSIVRVLLDRELLVRRARGYAPLPVRLGCTAPPILAVGAHLKNTVALTVGNDIFLSQHIGDLENREAVDAFHGVIHSFRSLYETAPVQLAADLHPEYISSKFAAGGGLPVTAVQHHFAHIAACMAENELEGRVLGVAWDGTGLGLDGTIWGGEFLLADEGSFRRFATFRRFRLPGGERAIREPRRTALGALYAILGDSACERTDLVPIRSFSPAELRVLLRMISGGVNSPLTSSAGRLFDAVAALTGLCERTSYEGQAAMELEFSIEEDAAGDSYPFVLNQRTESDGSPLLEFDWEPIIRAIMADLAEGARRGVIARRFHNTLVEGILAVAHRAGEPRVVLSGGCFQNRYLAEHAVLRLEREGFRPYWHQRIPPNDGGIAAGQAFAVAHSFRGKVEKEVLAPAAVSLREASVSSPDQT
jgi:hydrogenase maturation protein HypF